MSVLKWFKIINQDDFQAMGLTSHSVTVNFGALGDKEILVTQGNQVSLLVDGKFLSVSMNAKNPFEFEGYLVYLDPDNDIWLGLLSAS